MNHTPQAASASDTQHTFAKEAPLNRLAETIPAQGSTALRNWGVIRAQGTDAASFLQGQLTNDVAGLGNDRAMLAGYCSAKGRLLASFVVWRPAPETFLMACSSDVLQATLKRLSMFVLRAKCRLDDASAELRLMGHWQRVPSDAAAPHQAWRRGDEQGTALPDAVLGAHRFKRWLHVQSQAPASHVAETDDTASAAWALLEVASGVPRITSKTVDALVPQMVNFELLKGVSFSKGCYPGQEIVARSQYRGTLKRRLHVFARVQHDPSSKMAEVAEVGEVAEGTEVFHASDATQPVGIIVNVATFGEARLATISLKTAVLNVDTPAVLQAAGGSTWVHLPAPYPVPNEATD